MEHGLWMTAPPEKAALSLCEKNETLLSRYGLSLSREQAQRLVKREREALADTGRIEFGQGVLNKLIYALCDSPYLGGEDWTETLEAMVGLFYELKNESDGFVSDDELVDLMAGYFNGRAQGDLDAMGDMSLGELLRARR